MISIEDYMKLSREERTKHLQLDQKCIERGGHYNNFRGVLAQFLGTTFPSGNTIYVCHACNNGKCSNPYHLYWGTASENQQDYIDAGGMTFPQKVAAKYSKKQLKKLLSEAGRKGGMAPRKLKDVEKYRHFFDDEDLSKRGWPGRIAIKIGVSQTHVRRIAKRLNLPL